jgi:hypothetical protein
MPTKPAELPLVADTVQDGIRFHVELQRNPLPAGTPSWAKVTVTNVGNDVVTWLHDGCGMPGGLYGESEVAWSMGKDRHSMFKDYALGGSIVAAPSPFASLSFVPENLLGKGSFGCADIGIEETVKPGQSLKQTVWWTGFASRNRAIPPAGPMTLRAQAGAYWRGSGQAEPAPGATINLELTIPSWIDPIDDFSRLSPAEIVDAALDDPDFAKYVLGQKIANGREEIAWYQLDRDIWEVGVMPWYETTPPRIHGLVIDAETGGIIGPLDRAWNEDVDGFP